ncbi:hypothetical protein HUU53_04480 [Candidatus Micrarchaeota archaeon]|nr:hypothetical protein [Candidatus Micrarchaeota archaeon]
MKTLLLLLLLSVTVSALTQLEASEKVKTIIGDDLQIQSLNQPMEVDDERYWVFFYPLSTGKRTIIAVSEYSSDFERNKEKLTKIGNAVYDYLIIEEYLKTNKWDFSSLRAPVENTLQALEQNIVKTSNLVSIVQQKNYDLDLTLIETKTDDLRSLLLEANSDIIQGSVMQSNFEATLISYDLQDILTQYNYTYQNLIEFTIEFDDYKQKISELQTKVFKSSIPNEDRQAIYDNLEALAKIDVSQIYALKLQNPLDALNRRLNQKEAWTTESVEAFFFIKNKKEADDLYNQYKQSYTQIIDNQFNLEDCGLGSQVKNLTRTWSDVEALRAFTSSEAYSNQALKLRQVESLVQIIQSRYQECISTPQTTTTPQQTNNDYNAIIIALFVGIIVYVGFKYYQKTQQKEEYT